MNKKIPYYIVMALSGMGILISSYLSYVYILALPLPCSTHGCEVVRNSEYAKMFGIPTPLFGVAFYIATLFISILLIKNVHSLLTPVMHLFAIGGFLFSVYLTYLEIFVIHAICAWCVASAVVATGIFIAVHLKRFITMTEETHYESAAVPGS